MDIGYLWRKALLVTNVTALCLCVTIQRRKRNAGGGKSSALKYNYSFRALLQSYVCANVVFTQRLLVVLCVYFILVTYRLIRVVTQ